MNRFALLVILVGFMAACTSETPRRTDYAVEGIDVSRYQAVIDWQAVKEAGMQFAFIKATEGLNHVDSIFVRNWSECGDAGLYRGAYHFFRPRLAPLLQANHFIRTVDLAMGDLPPVIDVETLDGVHPQTVVLRLKVCLEALEQYYKVKPIIYTNLNYYNRYLSGQFPDHPLWIARYSNKMPETACGTPWTFWQYGDKGTIPGIEGYVDFNVFYGDVDELDKLRIVSRTALSAE